MGHSFSWLSVLIDANLKLVMKLCTCTEFLQCLLLCLTFCFVGIAAPVLVKMKADHKGTVIEFCDLRIGRVFNTRVFTLVKIQ